MAVEVILGRVWIWYGKADFLLGSNILMWEAKVE